MNIDHRENSHEVDSRFPNVFDFKEIAKLPDGLGFAIPQDESSPAGIDLIADEIQQIIQSNPKLQNGAPREWMKKSDKNFVIGQIMPGIMSRNYYSEKIIEHLLKRFPNLQWFRGGSLKVSKGLPTFDESMGMADGYLGDMRAFSYTQKNYDGQPRENAVLYMVSLKDLVEGGHQKAIGIGSHHRYDVSLSVKDPDTFKKWSQEAIKIYTVPTIPAERENMTQLLTAKAILL